MYTYIYIYIYKYIYIYNNMYVFSLIKHIIFIRHQISFRRNFLELNVYMRDLRVKEYEQLKGYTIIDLLSKANLGYCVCKIGRNTYTVLC